MPNWVFLNHFFFFVTIGLASYFLTRLTIRHFVVLDIPNERSSHTIPVPRGGGLAIVFSFLLGVLLIQYLGSVVPVKTPYFVSFILALVLTAAISYYDDLKHRGPTVKLGGQLSAILIAMALGNIIDTVYLPWIGELRSVVIMYPLTFVWLLGLTNAYNFLDGLDGMAASTGVIASIAFSYIAFHEGSHFIYLVSMSLGAASLGFGVLNWSPAKIFMGDVGSAFLGFAFGMIAIIAARYDRGHTSLFVMPLLLFHFIVDAVFTFACRMKNGDNLIAGHRTHIYQLMNRLGNSHRMVTLIYAGLAVIQGFAAVWMIHLPGEQRLLVFLPFAVVYLMAGLLVRRRAREARLL